MQTSYVRPIVPRSLCVLLALAAQGCGSADPPVDPAISQGDSVLAAADEPRRADEGDGATLGNAAMGTLAADSSPYAWVDIHTHCALPRSYRKACDSAIAAYEAALQVDKTAVPPEVSAKLADCCPTGAVSELNANKAYGNGIAVVLSLEHFSLGLDMGDPIPSVYHFPPGFIRHNNAIIAAAAARDPAHVKLFASMGCWHRLEAGADFKTQCEKDVDDWIKKGAIGFKDAIGKQSAFGDVDQWLGTFNRRLGTCKSTKSAACMAEVGNDKLIYPAMRDEYRAMLKYILETKKLPIVSHAIDINIAARNQGKDAVCYDPYTKTTDSCFEVTTRHMLDLGRWMVKELSPEARRRFILAHAGFQTARVEDYKRLHEILDTGISVDVSAVNWGGGLGIGGCEGRQFFLDHKDQLLFGTDGGTDGNGGVDTEAGIVDNPSSLVTFFDVYAFNFMKSIRDYKYYNLPDGMKTALINGLELQNAKVDQCDWDVAPDALSRVLVGNAFALYGLSPKLAAP